MGESLMLAPGIFYFWLKKKDVRGEYAVLITQQVLVKLNRQVCPRHHLAFLTKINKISTGNSIPSCQIAPTRPRSSGKTSGIARQLRKLERDVKLAAPLEIFISDLLLLEKAAHWSKRLQVVLEKYAQIEAIRNQRANEWQSTWLKTYLTTNTLAFEPTIIRWGRVQGTGLQWIPLFIYRDLTEREWWIFHCLGIQGGNTRWQWRVPLSVLERHYSILCPLLPGASNFQTLFSPANTNYVWGQMG